LASRSFDDRAVRLRLEIPNGDWALLSHPGFFSSTTSSKQLSQQINDEEV